MPEPTLLYALATLAAYLLGSTPFGLLAAKMLGEKDPRAFGSKNIGFTNVLRVCGKKAGALTLIGDIGKGLVATGIAQSFGIPRTWLLCIGLAVILGHIFSVFLAFKGGKGVATAIGSVLGMAPYLGLCMVGIWIGTVITFKYSSGGALAAFGGFPVLAILFGRDFQLIVFSVSVLALILYCHRDNISRLVDGTEPKMGVFSK